MKLIFCLLFAAVPICTAAQSALRIGKDTIKILNKELAITNSTKNIRGYLINTGNGKTSFKETGREIQFTVGNPGSPSPGDSIYTDSYYIKKSIKVWRNGLLQFAATPNGIRIDSSVGKIFFSPALLANDRVYIEALNGF